MTDLWIPPLDTDAALAADSDERVPSQKAVKTYAQPIDSDLTAIAGLDSSQEGVIASFGAGWLRKTWAQLKAKLGLALNAYDYGVTFDGVTDDTAAWQAVFDALVAQNGGQIVGIPPAGYGTSLINGTITVPWGTFWSLYAPGLTWKQQADNTPHLTITNTPFGDRSSVGWKVRGPWFTWTNQQCSTVATVGALSGTGTGTFVITSAGPFNSGTTTLLIDKEQMTGSFSGTTFTITARGANSTTAATHSAGATVYPVGQTSACAIYTGDASGHVNYSNFVVEKVGMANGSYLVGGSSSTAAMWGATLRDIYIDSTVVGGVYSAVSQLEGCPNNKFENIYWLGNSMVGPVFDFQGAQSTWMTGIEGNQSYLSPVIIRALGSMGSIAIGTLKSEVGTIDNRNGVGGALFVIANYLFEYDLIRLQGMTVDVTGMTRPSIFTRFSATGAQNWHGGTLDFQGDYALSASTNGWQITGGNYFLTDSGTTTGQFIVDQIYGRPARNFYLTDSSVAGRQDGIFVADCVRGRVSPNRGDADYTWDPFGLAASSTLSLSSGTNPADGDKVTIGGSQGGSVAYTFKNTLGAVNDVQIGADFAATLASLANAINGTGTPGTDYYTGTYSLVMTTAGAVSGTGASATLTVTANPGQIGNSFVSTKTGSVLSWTGTTFTGGAPPENVVSFESALTANRTVTLPTQNSATQTNMFNGAWVEIVRSGGGAFDLIIKQGAGEIARIYSGTTGSIRFAFRRGAWVIVRNSTTSAVSSATPADPAGTTSGTGQMMGLAGSIKPAKTGRVLVTLVGDIYNPSGDGDGAATQLRYGTGSAPANGAALAGTAVGAITKFINAVAAERAPFSNTAVITGLTVGTTYWLDCSLKNITGGTATIENLTLTAVEV